LLSPVFILNSYIKQNGISSPLDQLVPTPDKNIGHFAPKLMISVIPACAGMTEIHGFITVLCRNEIE
jgi:hypothetical protein